MTGYPSLPLYLHGSKNYAFLLSIPRALNFSQYKNHLGCLLKNADYSPQREMHPDQTGLAHGPGTSILVSGLHLERHGTGDTHRSWSSEAAFVSNFLCPRMRWRASISHHFLPHQILRVCIARHCFRCWDTAINKSKFPPSWSFLALSTMYLRFLHIASCLVAHFTLALNNSPLSGCTTQFVYLSTYWRTCWLLPCFSNYEQSFYEYLCVGFCMDVSFHPFYLLIYFFKL